MRLLINLQNLTNLFVNAVSKVSILVVFFACLFSFFNINSLAQTPATIDPCTISFCLGGVSTNDKYSDPNLSPGTRAAYIFGDVAWLMTGLIVSVAIIYVVYAGFIIMSANGKADQVKKGFNIILYAIIGIIVSVVAYGIVSSIIGIISNT